MATIGEIVSKQYFAWCDKMSRTKFSGMVCDSYEEYEYYLNKYFGCDL